MEDLKGQLEEEQDSKAHGDSNARRLMSDIEELKRKLLKETSDKQRAQDQKANFQRENDSLKSERDSLERRNRENERQVRDLRAQLEDSLSRLDTERRAKEKSFESVKELKKLLVDRERQNLEVITKLSSSNDADKQLLEDEIADLLDKNKQQQQRIEKLHDELDGSAAGSRTSSSKAKSASFSDDLDAPSSYSSSKASSRRESSRKAIDDDLDGSSSYASRSSSRRESSRTSSRRVSSPRSDSD